MVSARQDVQHRAEYDPRCEDVALPVSPPVRDGPQPIQRPIPLDAWRPARPQRLVPLRIHLADFFAYAAVVPALSLFALGAAGMGGALARLPFGGEAAVLLVVATSAGFGAALGLIVARGLAGPIAGLTRAVESLGVDATPSVQPTTEISEGVLLADALAALHIRAFRGADEVDERQAAPDPAPGEPRDQPVALAPRG